MISGSPAWNPQATLALVITSSSASSSPRLQTPNPSPRSALRSMGTSRTLARRRRFGLVRVPATRSARRGSEPVEYRNAPDHPPTGRGGGGDRDDRDDGRDREHAVEPFPAGIQSHASRLCAPDARPVNYSLRFQVPPR